MVLANLSLPPALFAAAFPFHIALDRDLMIVQAGASIERIAPRLAAGNRLADSIRIVRPNVAVTFEQIYAQRNGAFLLQALDSPLQLKGQIVYDDESQRLLFLGSPWITSTAALEPLGLGLQDFALHDSAADFLFLLQTQQAALADAKKLTARLNSQRAELHRANQELAMQNEVTRALTDATTLDEAIDRALGAIGAGIGWDVGAFWDVDQHNRLLRCFNLWHAPVSNLGLFIAATREMTLRLDSGLPGRVWSSGTPLWIADVTQESGFTRASAATQAGLRSGLAFPILFEQSVIGVIEFFSRESREIDTKLIEMLALLGRQIGQFFQRTRLQEEVARAQAAILAELSTPLIRLNNQVVIMPLVGAIDTRRAQQVMETLLHGVAAQGAAVAILDITGVSIVDTQVANGLIQAARAVRMLGAQVVLTGIRPEVAQALVGLGVDLREITTRGSLQAGILFAMGQG